MSTIYEKMTAVADAIRGKTGGTEQLTLDDMAVEIAGISTGVELNFDVVGGTTEPSNPIENTIWVNTDVEITGWTLRSIAPENPEIGMVWIAIGSSSQYPFNAIKQNEIYIYPATAKQYIDDGWVTKTAMTYYNSEWKTWELVLYEPGNECTDITGGWKAAGCSDRYSGGSGATPSVSRTSEYIKLGLYSTGSNIGGKIQMTNAIDFTPFSKMIITATGYTEGQWSGTDIRIYNKSGSTVAIIGTNGTLKQAVLDISKVNEDGYVACTVGTSNGWNAIGTATLTVYNITLQ